MREVNVQPQSWVVDDENPSTEVEETDETQPDAYSFSYARA